jgi:N-acetylneuraminate synthase
MDNFIEINGRKIGANYPPLVIAEIGINHEGNLKTASKTSNTYSGR